MRVLEVKPRYSQETGEQIGVRYAVKEHRCDFSGELMYDDLHESEPWITYTISYGGNDACWGCPEGESKLRNEYDVYGIHMLMQEEPFGIRWDREEAFKQAFVESDTTAFGHFLRECRAATALRLLEEGVIQPIQLEGYEGPEEIS
jgi:hypothetical protein